MALTYFIYNSVFDKYLNISSSYCNICLYQTKAKDINNVSNKISTFKLHGFTGYLFLCYLTTKKFKFWQVKLKQEKAWKKVLLNKATWAITQN